MSCRSTRAASPAVGAVVKDNTAFALDLYQREKGGNANLFFSPYSISTALAMVYAGARGETGEEMARVLHFSQPRAELHRAFGDLTRRFEKIQAERRVTVNVANSLWCQSAHPFEQSFLDLNREDYDVELRSVDFARRAEEVRGDINAWVARKTQGKVEELIRPGQINPLTRLLLCDAIYFKGNWATQFDPKATRSQPFFVTTNHSVRVPMMSRSLELKSREFEHFVMFDLPYEGKDLSMVVLLPDERGGLPTVERQLNAGALEGWLKSLESVSARETWVYLPKFKLNCRLDLADGLSAMGMKSAFGPGADFSGMDGKRDLFIGAVVHQAYVDVNEEGTEAAAATGVTMRTLALRRPTVLRVDHPFLFFIVERETGSILFMGRVTDPAKPG